jgi:hypothetical protein
VTIKASELQGAPRVWLSSDESDHPSTYGIVETFRADANDWVLWLKLRGEDRKFWLINGFDGGKRVEQTWRVVRIHPKDGQPFAPTGHPFGYTAPNPFGHAAANPVQPDYRAGLDAYVRHVARIRTAVEVLGNLPGSQQPILQVIDDAPQPTTKKAEPVSESAMAHVVLQVLNAAASSPSGVQATEASRMVGEFLRRRGVEVRP